MNKVTGGILGFIVGLLASYLFKPNLLGGLVTISFTDWFSETGIRNWGGTIFICAFIGLVLGMIIGSFADNQANKKSSN